MAKTKATKPATHFLVVGQVYDLDRVRSMLIGWTYGDGTGHEGYHVDCYFDTCGRYLGPDDHDIEPLIELAELAVR